MVKRPKSLSILKKEIERTHITLLRTQRDRVLIFTAVNFLILLHDQFSYYLPYTSLSTASVV